MNDERRIEELDQLIGSPSNKFKQRLHRSIERRVLTRDISVMYWEIPKMVLSEALFICAEWLTHRKPGPGGQS